MRKGETRGERQKKNNKERDEEDRRRRRRGAENDHGHIQAVSGGDSVRAERTSIPGDHGTEQAVYAQ